MAGALIARTVAVQDVERTSNIGARLNAICRSNPPFARKKAQVT